MDTETVDLLRASLRSLLATPPADIASALEELGWAEVLADDATTATSMLFEHQGEQLASTAALDGVACAALGLDPLTRIVWPYPGKTVDEQPGADVYGIVLAPLAPGAAVVVRHGGGVVKVDPTVLQGTRIGGIDPSAGWRVVEGVLESVGDARVTGNWSAAVGAARRALASELVGVARTALGIAREHVGSRVQFGRPIGSFQAVRHRLAGAFATLCGAEALVAAAWEDGGNVAAVLAKAAAARAHFEVVSAAMQVCGGMGLSDEHPLPACVRRGLVLDILLGSARELSREQGLLLLHGGELPAVGDF